MSEPISLEVGKRYKFKIDTKDCINDEGASLYYNDGNRITNVTNEYMFVIGTIISIYHYKTRIFIKDVVYL